MRKLIGVLIALAAAPILALVALLPAMADVNMAGGNACAPQSANPHATDPAGSTIATIFCTPPSPTPTASGTGTTGSGNGNSGSNSSNGSESRGTTSNGGGATTTLASSTSASTTPDESMRFDWQSNAAKSAGTGSQPSANSGQVTGGLLAFFSGVGGLIFLFSLLALLVLIGLVAAAIAWMRHGQVPWASHAARLTYRPKP